ncbi:uncharacterized protein LOC126713274 isoform X2 [Quercus robur]|uniref:uncharacterized protein LOC126713274 isoform X2 n=1 Tax=Quercus robur TaxID=38942 RepID=UPI0021631E61|nr:uncharacterized protein LOC126713274 isoform X2 [Quercus robur]
MGVPQTPNPPHLSPALQLKLYQAFIFSIPILFSIILLLLFYLFYLKRRASTLSYPPPILSRSPIPASAYFTSPSQVGLKGEIKDKLPTILFDEELRTKESQCLVTPTKLDNPAAPPSISEPLQQDSTTSNQHTQNESSEQQQQQQQADRASSNLINIPIEHTTIAIEGSSSENTRIRETGRLPDLSNCRENEMDHSPESVVLHIRMQ